jgi:hypothetical protein
MKTITEGIPLDLEISQFLSQLLHFADLVPKLRVLIARLSSLSTPIELELLSTDSFLSRRRSTFFSMISSMRALFLASRALKVAISGLGINSFFLGSGGMTVFSSMRSAL